MSIGGLIAEFGRDARPRTCVLSRSQGSEGSRSSRSGTHLLSHFAQNATQRNCAWGRTAARSSRRLTASHGLSRRFRARHRAGHSSDHSSEDSSDDSSDHGPKKQRGPVEGSPL